MAVINTNVKALFSQMALKSTDRSSSVAMQQLSTGKRINSARDDASGMSIATRMTHQIRSLNQAVRNAGDAISLIQTAEGATNEITDMMQRMRELAVQAVNDTNANADRSYLDLEFQQLKQQIVQIADNTEWNGFSVLSGKAGQQVGEMPVYKATSQNQYSDIFISPTTSRTVYGTGVADAVETTATPTESPYLMSGSVKIDVDHTGNIKATFATPDVNAAPITLNATKVMSGNAWTGEIKFLKSDTANSLVLAKDVSYKFTDSSGTTVASPIDSSLQVDVNGGIPTLHNGDLTINGIVIGPSSAADDRVSPLNNAAGSAIAKAAAINAKAVDQGVSQGEIQAITFSGTPNYGPNQTANITVAGVKIDLTSGMDTPVLVAKTVAAQLQADPTFNNSGCTVSWSTGSPTVTVNYPTSSGNVDKIVVTGSDELGFTSVTNTTQQYAAVQPGTGVFAKVNENVFGGQAMSGLSVVTGRVYVNGYASADIQSVMNNPQATRSNVVRAINLISDKTGVKAIDSGSDDKGITLVAADGRNIEVQFQTTGTTTKTDFGQRLGLREGVQSATISLESKIPNPAVLGSITGNISNVGFDAGNYSKNEATVNTHARDLGQAAVAQVTSFKFSSTGAPAEGDTVSVVVNGQSYKHTVLAATETLKDAFDDIYAQLTAAATAPKNVLVSRGSSDEILITATEPGVPFSASSTNSTGATFSSVTTEKVANAKADVVGLSMNDLMINGVTIRATDAKDDTNSDVTVSSSDRASSAIALAAAINDSTSITGVRAVPNPVVLTGTSTSVDNPPTGPQDLWVNGHKVTVVFDTADTGPVRRKNVAEAINKNLEGITATYDDYGVTITAADGRNVSAWFDSTVKGLSAANFGLDMGGTKAQESTIDVTTAPTDAGDISIQLNGQTITVTLAGTETAAEVASLLETEIGTAISANGSKLANLLVTAANGKVTIKSAVPGSSFDLRGVNTDDTGTEMELATPTPNDPGKNIVTGVNFSDDYKQNVLGGTQTYPAVKTAYGTVKLIAAAPNLPGLPDADGLTSSRLNLNGQPIRIQTGSDGFNAQSNFKDLGFYEGVFGGRASVDMDPPRVGRLAFQVGSSANQTITIDLADFGKNGPITSGITGDVDQKLENRTVRINTRDGASQVLNLLDVAMEKVNATRSTMGAVMNRLDHVINNLTNVSMNMSASRSQIEDADYAAASTELAKTQIMQQAATAVLAQANTSQQSVMKLLGG